MKTLIQELINLAIQCKALQFGAFQLKSGRISPYFFNAGLFNHGAALQKLGELYAETLLRNDVKLQHLFGPAYKGIPLATATAIALAQKGIITPVTFNRKETKTHGETGQLMGAPLSGPTIMIDDVITAGTAFRESKELIAAHGGQLTTVIIALDRQEKGLHQQSTLQEIQQSGIQVLSIMTLHDLLDYLTQQQAYLDVQRIEAYQQQYGCSS